MSLQTLFRIGNLTGKGLVGSFFGEEKASPAQVIQLSEEERKKRAISFLGAEEYGYPYPNDDAPNILIPEPLVQTQTSFIPSATTVPEVIDAPRGQVVRGLGNIILEIERINRNISNIQLALSDRSKVEEKYREGVIQDKKEEIVERDKLRSQRRASQRRESLFGRAYQATGIPGAAQGLTGSLIQSGILTALFGAMDFIEKLSSGVDDFIEGLRLKLPNIFGDPAGPGGRGSSGKPLDIGKIPITDPEAKAAIALIRRVEGTLGEKGPSTFFGGSQYGGDLTKKTFAEVAALQKKFLAEGQGQFYDKKARKMRQSAAVGIGQFLEPEQALKDYLGLDPEKTKFDERTQTALIIAIAAQKRGVDLTKPLTQEDLRKLNAEWAGLGPKYGQTTRTIGQSMKIYQDYLKQIKEIERKKTTPMTDASKPGASGIPGDPKAPKIGERVGAAPSKPMSMDVAKVNIGDQFSTVDISANVKPSTNIDISPNVSEYKISDSGTPSIKPKSMPVEKLGPKMRTPIVIDARVKKQIEKPQETGVFAKQKDIASLEPRLINSGHEAMFA